MKGWLVVNEFVRSDKFYEIYNYLENSAKSKNVEIVRYTNADLCLTFDGLQKKIDIEKPQFCIFWDKDILLAQQLELCGLRLFNSAKAIEVCDNKALTYINLLNKNIAMPKTLVLPKRFRSVNWNEEKLIFKIIEILKLPLIIKECHGSFGQQVYLVNTKEQLIEKLCELNTTPIILQEFIKSSFAKDIRINVVGGKVVTSMLRYSANGDFRANISNGGKMKAYLPTKEECDLAINACNALNLDFAGVDILFGEDNKPILCEVNSNAHFMNIYNCTGVNVADYIIDYIIKEVDKNGRLVNI